MPPDDPGRAALARHYAACVRVRVAAERDEAEALAQLRRYEADAAEDAQLEAARALADIVTARAERARDRARRVEELLARKEAA